MKHIGIILFLFPALLEIIYPKQFIIDIPGLPYSLGQFSYILMGFTGLREVRINALGQVGKAFLLIYGGMFLASLLNGNILEDLSKSLGTFFHFVAALGWSRLLLKKQYLHWLDTLMISLFLFWMFYVLSTSFSGGSFVSYSKAYLNDRAVNHHIPGIIISTATFYLLIRFFIDENKFKPLGFVLLGISISAMLVLESRSNFLVSILMSLVTYRWIKKEKSSNLLRWLPIVFFGYFVITFMMDSFEFIGERFELNSDYHEHTTMGRREVYARFPFELAQNPFGRGPNDYRLNLGRVTLNAHNTYLTLIIMGGILALIGVLGFLVKQIRIGIRGKWFRQVIYQTFPKQIYAGYIAALVYFITLLTIEQSNLLFYISLANLLTAEYIFDSIAKFKLTLGLWSDND